MKKSAIIAAMMILFPVSALFLHAKTRHFWRGELMSVKKVCKRWGESPLDVAKFKAAEEDESVRARMACTLLKSQKEYIGRDRGEIRNIFGDYSGHYFSDMFPTYLIEKAQEKGQDSWQIVFLLNRKEKISKIVVHKNCCYVD